MQNLHQTLQDHDRGHLSIIAELWGVDLPRDRHEVAVQSLSEAMLEAAPEIVDALSDQSRAALELLLEHGGRVSMEALIRRFGPLREMGPGRRDRQKPWREPHSPLEELWYRGLVARAFADSRQGPQEYGFVPQDLVPRLPEVSRPPLHPLGSPAPEPAEPSLAETFAVDDATTVLAAFRRSGGELSEPKIEWLKGFLRRPQSLSLLTTLLAELEVLSPQPKSDQIRDFLRAPRIEALAGLLSAWLGSTLWNDLAHTPNIESRTAEWPNDPRVSRGAGLRSIMTVPTGTWWSVNKLIDSVLDVEPEFLRGVGGFESWYLQGADDGSNLRGFDSWRRVEDEYLRYLLRGPLHWLGASDLSPDGSAFRLTKLLDQSRSGAAMDVDAVSELGTAVARPDGRIRVARSADRVLRYQIARIAAWENMEAGAYTYRISARSLEQAALQGLTRAQACRLLSGVSLPAHIQGALDHWARQGTLAEVKPVSVLQVERPEVLSQLQADPGTARYLTEVLGPSSTVIDPRDWSKLRKAALQNGLLIGGPDDLSDEPD